MEQAFGGSHPSSWDPSASCMVENDPAGSPGVMSPDWLCAYNTIDHCHCLVWLFGGSELTKDGSLDHLESAAASCVEDDTQRCTNQND
eukprot:2310129-Rhodomonas_salina.1